MVYYTIKTGSQVVWGLRVLEANKGRQDLVDIYITLMYGCGVSSIILVGIRASSPLVQRELKRFLTCSKPTKMQYENKTLTSFLNSSINVEYVVMILEGISAVLKHREYQGREVIINASSMQGGIGSDQFVQIVASDGERSTTYKVPDIQIKKGFDLEKKNELNVHNPRAIKKTF